MSWDGLQLNNSTRYIESIAATAPQDMHNEIMICRARVLVLTMNERRKNQQNMHKGKATTFSSQKMHIYSIADCKVFMLTEIQNNAHTHRTTR